VSRERAAGGAVPAQRADSDRFSGTPAGPALDRLADLARRLLGTESAQVSLLSDVQTVAGGAGLPSGTIGSTGPLADSLCTVTARGGGPFAVTDASSDERVATLPPVTSGVVGSYLGVPLVTERGETVGALCAFGAGPRQWDDADVLLLQQLAASVIAELELAALAGEYQSTLDRWGLAIDAAGIGSFDWDLRTGQLLWDDRLLAMFGYDRTDFGRSIADFDARVHADDLPEVHEALQAAVEACGTFEAEYRVLLPDGGTRWLAARGRAVAGADGKAARVLGATYDTTDFHDVQARTARVLEAMSAAFYSLDTEWRFTYVNAEAERLLGLGRDDLLGGVLWDLFPATLGADFETYFRGAAETGRAVTFEAYYPPPLDGWYELRVWPSPDGLAVYFLDITARRAAQARVEAATRQARLVADVTTRLSDTLDAEEAVARLAPMLVPELADWCLITLVDDDGTLRDVGWAHADEDMQETARQYFEVRLAALDNHSFVAEAMRTGQPRVLIHDATPRIEAVLTSDAAVALLRQLAPESAAILPMQARGRTIGLLSLFSGAGREPYDASDLSIARDVAGRAALALDNARLFQQQRQLAEELQRSLLTPPPEPDHMQVVVRYVPAAQAAQVGGDWYDAFLQPDGATVLVIGDVVGHDTAAAAAMGQVRGLLRGIAFTTGEGPAKVLSRLDAAIEGLQVSTTATAVVARIEQTDAERERGVTHLRWSNAGHPPPMALLPEGEVLVLGGVDADLLLGFDARSERVESKVTLDRGTTVLLYTDGLVESRGQSLDEGLQRLRDELAALAHLTLDELCDELLARLTPSTNDDDVALVAVRLHPQDRPRPPEAGPRIVPPEVPPEGITATAEPGGVADVNE
jgi:PAS domain S-box-containing protein